MLVVGGESLVDLVQERQEPDGVLRLAAHPGGSPYNCAIALSRLGNRTGFICPISQDRFGDLLLAPLERAGVASLLPCRVAEPTTLAVVTLDDAMQARYEFYRGADRAFGPHQLVAALPQNPELLQVGGFCAIEPSDAEAWLELARTALGRGAVISVDPNVRPSLVEDFAGYRLRLDRVFSLAHIVKVSIEDLEALDAVNRTTSGVEETIARWVANLLGQGNCELVVVTLGGEGSRAFARGGASATQGIFRPPVFGDTVGAGDSLMAGILSFLNEAGELRPGRLAALPSQALARMLRFGAVVAGLNCGRIGCDPPRREQVDAVLAAG